MSELQRYREAAARQAIRAEKAEATIAQQQARIDELKLALDKADPLDPSFLRYLELEQALAAERERAEDWEAASKETGQSNWTKAQWRQLAHLAKHARDEFEQQLQAEREKSAALHQRFAEAVQAKERLERQLERHATLLHNSHHNWALHSVVDCPELECEEYRALLSPAPEEK